MNRIDKKLNEEGKLLSIYFTAGYPSLNDTEEIIVKLEESGVDMIELSLIHISEPTRLLAISYAVFCLKKKIFLMIRRPPRSTLSHSSAASDVYKRQLVAVGVTLSSEYLVHAATTHLSLHTSH